MSPLHHSIERIRALLVPSHWHKSIRHVIKVEASGLRTAAAVMLPLILGQIMGQAAVGLMIGLGGLYVAIADKEGATWRTMLIVTLGAAAAVLIGTLVGNNVPLAIAMMFLFAFVGGMMNVFGVLPGNIGFVITLVFAVALGIPADSHAALGRFVEFGMGGLWATLLTLVLWRVTPGGNEEQKGKEQHAKTTGRRQRSAPLRMWKHALRKLKRNLTLRSEVCHHALRLGFISALAATLYKTLLLEHGAWLTITVLVIVKPDYADTRKRAAERVFGTLFGGVLALLLTALLHSILVVDVILLCLSALAFSHVKNNYGLYVVFLTPFVVLLLNMATPGDTKLALIRVGDTLAGGALALFAAYLLRPRQRQGESSQ